MRMLCDSLKVSNARRLRKSSWRWRPRTSLPPRVRWATVRTSSARAAPSGAACAPHRLFGMVDVVWRPGPETLERANVVGLMRRHGFSDYRELVRRSQEDPDWFWPAAIEDMELEFSRPWDRVFDDSRGP